ncbi:MAG: hypothetical protein V3T88_04220 [Nitrosomonadaceae bacterium]
MSHILQFYPDGLISTLTADSGGAIVPVARNIDILGGTNITTVGTVGTITVNLDDSISLAGSITVGTSVTLTSITDGGLIADASGVVTASAGFTDPFTGFATWTGAGAYYDDSVLGTFEVSRGGTGYIKGIEIAWAGGQSVTGLTGGATYYIYMDDTGTIGSTATRTHPLYEDNIVLFEMLRDSSAPTNFQTTVRDNHPFQFPWDSSNFAHDVIGTVIENNLRGANITLNGTQKIEIVGADELDDHGLHTIIPDGGGTAETWIQMLTNAGGKWITYQSSDTFDGYWNSGGTATAPSGSKFSVYTLYISKDDLNTATPTYCVVLDDQEYNNLNAAQTAIADGTVAIATAEFVQLEVAQLGFIIYQQSIDTIVDVIIAKATLRSTISGGSGTNLASLVLTDVTNFDGILSATDTTVQVSLDTIDEWGKSTTDHAVLLGQGTGTPIISLAVATNGQLIIGSTGADPTVGSVTSTDGTITFTAGAGTLVIEGTDATETQDGVVELATDAEAIAGTDAVRAIVPTSLKAKLGTQTDHAILVGSGTTAAVTALAVGTNGQLPVGSTGADPVFATITSTDGTITFTAGAGTLVIEGTDATETQDGVVELATDAEAIAGTDAVRAIVPTSLKAKLGTQTDHGILVGSGTTAAVTALAVGTNGQVAVGSTGADPVFATIGSTDGTLTITGGAGTLVIEGTDASTTQEGVVELTTDAEATAGTDTTRAVTAEALKAKLGTQTDHGLLVGSGTTAAVTALAVGTNGQVAVGSTGADPVFATIGSTDGTLTVTGGAGTLVIEGTDASTTQEGVVELTTDAEATAGTDTTRAVTAEALKAKLGTQTDHGVLVGSATTAAVTALAVGTNGQLLVGSTGADPVFATIASADASVEFTLGAGTLDLSVAGILTTVVETGTTYELLLTDVGKLVTCNNAAAIALTIPVNADVAIPVGSQVLVTQLGAGVVTLTPEGGVTLNSRGSLLDTNGQYATVACVKILTNTWIISGDVA